jgi:hypothetical protein
VLKQRIKKAADSKKAAIAAFKKFFICEWLYIC